MCGCSLACSSDSTTYTHIRAGERWRLGVWRDGAPRCLQFVSTWTMKILPSSSGCSPRGHTASPKLRLLMPQPPVTMSFTLFFCAPHLPSLLISCIITPTPYPSRSPHQGGQLHSHHRSSLSTNRPRRTTAAARKSPGDCPNSAAEQHNTGGRKQA